MALPSPETQFKVASEAAQVFVDHYYEALTRRRPLNGFYASTSARLTAAGVKPDISVNGLPCADVAAYEALLEAQGGPVAYDVGSFDAHPVNPHYRAGEPDDNINININSNNHLGGGGGGAATAAAATVRNGDRMSFAVQVSGTIRYGRGHNATGEDSSSNKGGANSFGGGGVAAGGDAKPEDAVQEKDFNEAFLLVPHWEAWARNAPRGLRKWVIVSQNFRAL
ncbi:hypothetical protein K449DRAFT_419582 [Hypoxylon sp. EC38]|nr:hypothetical protein K449DRAFT_419582 [Hypoxylon sp. EC38]OTA87271.1 hypothetical protein M434DRAFT_399545 [Hypoxylon sp. CO27-5]